MFKIILVLAILLSFAGVFGQDKSGLHELVTYSVEDGLSQSSVQDICQDVFGYIWVSTGDGLNCFDGTKFTRYYFHSLFQGTEQCNSFRNVMSDSIGNLWVGTDRGILFLDRSKDILTQPFPYHYDLVNRPCLPLFCNRDSVSVLVSGKGIYSVHIRQQSIKRIPYVKNLLTLTEFSEIQEEKWFGFFPSSLLCIKHQLGEGIRLKEYPLKKPMDTYFTSIINLSEGKYLAASTDKLFILSELSGVVEELNIKSWKFLPENFSIKALSIDSSGKTWLITTNHGIFILNKDFSLYEHIKGFTSKGLEHKEFENISAMFKDNFGNLWIGSDGDGLAYFDQQKTRFGLIDKIDLVHGQISKPLVRCFLQDAKNRLWIGTYNSGLLCWNREKNTFTQLLLEARTDYPSANDIYCLASLSENKILAGTSHGLWVIDIINSNAFAVDARISALEIQKITCIVPLGLNSFELLQNNKPVRFIYHENGSSFLPSVFPDSVLYDKIYTGQGAAIYAFSRTGFFKADRSALTFHWFTYQDRKVSLKVNAVHETPTGALWLATGQGLIEMDAQGNVLEVYDDKAGLPNHFLYGIMADEHGNLWISSNRGLSEFDMQTRQVKNYGIEDGLQSLEFNTGAYFKSRNGELFFGGINGFNYFYPDSVHTQALEPAICIHKIFVNDQPFQGDTCSMALKSLNLRYKQNTIAFELNVLDYTWADHRSYSYMLEGNDRDWIKADKHSIIRYSHLKPGDYTFKVSTGKPDTHPDSMPLILKVHIQKPFWMETSFLIVAILAVVSIIIFSVRHLSTIKMKKQIAHLEHQRELSSIRSRIASDLHDDVGSNLSKLAMMSDKARMHAQDESEFRNYLVKISGDARQMIDQLRVIVWTLNPQEDKLDSLIAYVHQHISDFLEDFPINYKVLIPSEIQNKTISAEFRRNVYYAIREAVHNTVKHSGAKDLQVLIEIKDNQLKVMVEDNGTGFDLNAQHTFGNGIHFMKKRIADLAGNAIITGKSGVGTRVEFSVPL